VALKLIMAAMIATIASRAAAIELPPNFEEAAVVPGGPNGLAWPVGFAFLPDGSATWSSTSPVILRPRRIEADS
jgi:hypothetical protein